MNKNIIITENSRHVRLRAANDSDIELLREWKNSNKKSFFYQQEISKAQQAEWFSAYKQRENDYMFMVEEIIEGKHIPVGCMGFRILNNYIDLYNIIRGAESSIGVSMHRAMYIMLNYIRNKWNAPIQCDVLKDNPAVNWYLKCGFVILENKDYLVMTINMESIANADIEIFEANT